MRIQPIYAVAVADYPETGGILEQNLSAGNWQKQPGQTLTCPGALSLCSSDWRVLGCRHGPRPSSVATGSASNSGWFSTASTHSALPPMKVSMPSMSV